MNTVPRYLNATTILCCTLFTSSCVNDMNVNDIVFARFAESSISGKQKADAGDYCRWIEEPKNGIKVQKEIGNLSFAVLYKPYEYLALMELKQLQIDKKQLNIKMKEFNDLQYFTFRISAPNEHTELLKVGLASEGEYYSRIEYFAFKMQNDLKLIDGNDTLNCCLFHFERIYGVAPYATFVTAFPLTKDEKQSVLAGKASLFKDKTFLYDDKIFGVGRIYLTIKAENLNRIPELSVN